MKLETIENRILTSPLTFLKYIYPDGILEGYEYCIGNIQGDKGRSLKINIKSGKWSDFESGESASHIYSLFIQFFMWKHNYDQSQAIIHLRDFVNNTEIPKNSSMVKPLDDFIQCRPEFIKKDFYHREYGNPVAVYEYKDIKGDLINYICRYQKDNKKMICPFTFGVKNDVKKWYPKHIVDNRPLYNVEATKSDKILIVEGEKVVDYLISKGINNVITWQGGSNSYHKANWSSISHKKIIISPDNDKAGFNCANAIKDILIKQNCKVLFVKPDSDKPEGWDLADCKNPLEYIKNNITDSLPVETKKEITFKKSQDFKYYSILGNDGDRYYFINHVTNRIITMTVNQITSKTLLELAPRSYWFSKYSFDGKKPDFEQAVDDIIQDSQNKPYFDFEKIKGKGVYNINGVIVLNTGEKLIIKGEPKPLDSIENEFFVASKPMEIASYKPINKNHIKDIKNIFDYLPVRNDIDRKLLLGWCICAQISGVLKWRPHIWLTGQSGSGKSWIMNNIIEPLVSSRAIYPEAGTTEAGIRQGLCGDTLAIVYEEAESRNPKQAEKMNSIIELARTASSSSKRGAIFKGSVSGGSSKFIVRSCFCFLGIQPVLDQQADRSRIHVFEFLKDEDQERFIKLDNAVQILTPELCDSFFMSIIDNIQHIKESIEKVKRHFMTVGKMDSRTADQISSMIGAYVAMIDKDCDLNISEDITIIRNPDTDAEILLRTILESLITVEGQGIRSKPVSEMLKSYYKDSPFAKSDCQVLENYGIVPKKDYYGITDNTNIRKLLKGTMWEYGFVDTLKRHKFCLDKDVVRVKKSDGIRTTVIRIKRPIYED